MEQEHKIILEICRDNDNIDIDMEKEQLASINWSEFLWHLSSHKIDSLAAKKKINHMPLSAINNIAGRDLHFKYLAFNYRNMVIFNKILPEIIAIMDQCIDFYAITKGAVSALLLYKFTASRYFNDIDILINKSDLKKVKQAFYDAGYKCLMYDYKTKTVKEATPEGIKFYEMTTHQTYPFCKKIDDPICNMISVDINFGLGPEKAMKDKNFIYRILERRTLLEKDCIKMPVLSKEYLLLHCCLHIFRDSTSLFHIKDNSDVKLYQYVDLHRMIIYWHNQLDWDYVGKISVEAGITKPVYYSLYHCVMIFNEIRPIVDEFLRVIEPENMGYLNEYGMENNETGKWGTPFLERLFVKNRYALVKEVVGSGNFSSFKNREVFAEKYL